MPEAIRRSGIPEDDGVASPPLRIGLITPSLNQASFIEETLQSVLGQEYPNLEYRVQDGGSNDGTVDILRKYQDRLAWTSAPDGGQSQAINAGFRRVSGEIVGYLNSDDLLEPGALATVADYFTRHPRAMWLTGGCRIIDGNGREIRRGVTAYKTFWLRFPSRAVLQVLNYISQPATFWRRELLDDIGGFDEMLRYAMDYDYWLRIWEKHPLHVIDAPLARYRVHAASKAGSSAGNQFEAEMAIARRRVRSRMLLSLHAAHNAAVVAVYRRLQGGEHERG